MMVKICGLKSIENILDVMALRPDMVGFIFYKNSKRYVGDNFVMPECIFPIKRIGVFVNESIEEIIQLAMLHGLDGVQLHGNESVLDCKALHELGFLVIKAIAIHDNIDLNEYSYYEPYVNYFLLDTYSSSYGGSGLSFDWQILNRYCLAKPFILSGGIGLNSLEQIKLLEHKMFFGVDANSKLEDAPGIKNIPITAQFIKAIKNEQI